MSDRGAVFDLGYVPHDGPRLGRSAAIAATVRDGLRRVLGLRRRARKKILPWLFIAIAVLPAVGLIGVLFLIGGITAASELIEPLASHAAYFGIVAPMVVLFSALAAPALLINDREDGVLSVYSSRPLTTYDYLAARAGALAIVVGGFMILPHTLLYLGFASLGTDGFAAGLADGAGDYGRAIAGSLVTAVAYGMPALFVATYAKRVGVATGAYLGLMFGAGVFPEVLVEAGNNWAGWLALTEHPAVINDWLFDVTSSNLIPVRAGLEWWASLVVIIAVAVLATVLADRRYRRLM